MVCQVWSISWAAFLISSRVANDCVSIAKLLHGPVGIDERAEPVEVAKVLVRVELVIAVMLEQQPKAAHRRAAHRQHLAGGLQSAPGRHRTRFELEVDLTEIIELADLVGVRHEAVRQAEVLALGFSQGEAMLAVELAVGIDIRLALGVVGFPAFLERLVCGDELASAGDQAAALHRPLVAVALEVGHEAKVAEHPGRRRPVLHRSASMVRRYCSTSAACDCLRCLSPGTPYFSWM